MVSSPWCCGFAGDAPGGVVEHGRAFRVGARLAGDATRPHQGRWCFGKTPMRTFLDAMPMTKEKMIAA
jgi:hypothetical protein